MKCSCCGKDIGEFTFDNSYQMPDEVFSLNEGERESRAQIDSDLCRLDDRYFLRGVVYLPVNDSDKEFGWGIWAEVSEDRFFEYVRNYESDNSNKAQFSGKVANSLPYYPETLNISLQVKLGNETQRPLFKLVEQDICLLSSNSKVLP